MFWISILGWIDRWMDGGMDGQIDFYRVFVEWGFNQWENSFVSIKE